MAQSLFLSGALHMRLAVVDDPRVTRIFWQPDYLVLCCDRSWAAAV